ncbi:MAG: hypothetical protein GY832_37505, partial [Chloroflexi bacterium]|nr:hypothetical protein [Chloroflexota bacterium]
EKKSGYYNIEADGSIPASLVAEKTYYAQIATSDDGKITIGTIHESQFKPEAAQAICDKAVALGKDWDWWQANYREWWRTNWMVNREP